MNELTANTHHQPSTPQQLSNTSQRRSTTQNIPTQQPININHSGQQSNQSQTTTPTAESGILNSNKKSDSEKIKYDLDMTPWLTTNHDSTIPSFILTNVSCMRQQQYAFLVTFNGDIFFINLSQLIFNHSKIWHRSINNIVLNCFKVDINVNYFNRVKRRNFNSIFTERRMR